MKHLSPLTWTLAGAAQLAMAGVACGRSHETSDAGASASSASAPSASASWLTRRQPGWTPPPPPSHSASAGPLQPVPARAPDWDLSSNDAARDYARRYAFFTRRYGDNVDCVAFGASQPAGDKRSVEAKTAASCPGAGAQRDVFLVDVPGDRLTVDDKNKRDPLARWPDGSDPEGPPAPVVREIWKMNEWKSPLNDALQRHLLVAVRLQAYGRGSYPVISLAGWHDVVQLDAPADALAPLARDMCQANGGMPLGILAAADRTRILRIRCPAATAWDRL